MCNQLEDPHREMTTLESNYMQLERGSSHDCDHQPYTKNYRQWQRHTAGRGRGDHPQGRTQQQAAHCQMVSLEKHTYNNICTQQVILMNIYACTNTYMYAITIEKKQGMNLKESGERYMGRKGKGGM